MQIVLTTVVVEVSVPVSVVDDTVAVLEVVVWVDVVVAVVVVFLRLVVGLGLVVVPSTHFRKKTDVPTTLPPAFLHFEPDEHLPSKRACPFWHAMHSLAPAGHSYLQRDKQRARESLVVTLESVVSYRCFQLSHALLPLGAGGTRPRRPYVYHLLGTASCVHLWPHRSHAQ